MCNSAAVLLQLRSLLHLLPVCGSLLRAHLIQPCQIPSSLAFGQVADPLPNLRKTMCLRHTNLPPCIPAPPTLCSKFYLEKTFILTAAPHLRTPSLLKNNSLFSPAVGLLEFRKFLGENSEPPLEWLTSFLIWPVKVQLPHKAPIINPPLLITN